MFPALHDACLGGIFEVIYKCTSLLRIIHEAIKRYIILHHVQIDSHLVIIFTSCIQ